MEQNEMSSKINEISNEMRELKNTLDKRISIAEEKFSRFVQVGVETKSLYSNETLEESANFINFIRLL